MQGPILKKVHELKRVCFKTVVRLPVNWVYFRVIAMNPRTSKLVLELIYDFLGFISSTADHLPGSPLDHQQPEVSIHCLKRENLASSCAGGVDLSQASLLLLNDIPLESHIQGIGPQVNIPLGLGQNVYEQGSVSGMDGSVFYHKRLLYSFDFHLFIEYLVRYALQKNQCLGAVD